MPRVLWILVVMLLVVVGGAATVGGLMYANEKRKRLGSGGERKALWLFLITIPFWTSYLLRVFAWKIILGYNGVVNSSLMELGILAQPMEFLLYNVNAVVITLAHAWAPFAILPIFVSLEKIDRSLLEAATDLGDGPIRRFLRVTLPLSLPGVVAAALTRMRSSSGECSTSSTSIGRCPKARSTISADLFSSAVNGRITHSNTKRNGASTRATFSGCVSATLLGASSPNTMCSDVAMAKARAACAEGND